MAERVARYRWLDHHESWSKTAMLEESKCKMGGKKVVRIGEEDGWRNDQVFRSSFPNFSSTRRTTSGSGAGLTFFGLFEVIVSGQYLSSRRKH
jgi:hypothetical protein